MHAKLARISHSETFFIGIRMSVPSWLVLRIFFVWNVHVFFSLNFLVNICVSECSGHKRDRRWELFKCEIRATVYWPENVTQKNFRTIWMHERTLFGVPVTGVVKRCSHWNLRQPASTWSRVRAVGRVYWARHGVGNIPRHDLRSYFYHHHTSSYFFFII